MISLREKNSVCYNQLQRTSLKNTFVFKKNQLFKYRKENFHLSRMCWVIALFYLSYLIHKKNYVIRFYDGNHE